MAEAIRIPAVEGTQGTLAGTLRRPGEGASSCRVSAAGSGLYTTCRCRMPPNSELKNTEVKPNDWQTKQMA